MVDFQRYFEFCCRQTGLDIRLKNRLYKYEGQQQYFIF